MNRALRFDLYLLGAFRLERDGMALDLASRKNESLLAFLALEPQPHSRDELATLLWGDSFQHSARHSLSVALNTLRRKIAADLVVADRSSVQLNPNLPLRVDARDLEKFAANPLLGDDPIAPSPFPRAVSRYVDLLVDFYDDWVLAKRERYRTLYLDAMLALVQQYRARSEYARAIECAARVLNIDPANERAHQHLMFCFVVTGERHKALAQYETCVQALREELGIEEPSPETRALYEWIRQSTATPSLAARLTNLPLPMTSFIGRAKELDRVQIQLREVRLVTLTGAGGSGKTRLAIRAGISALDTFRDGVWWIDLAPLQDAARVPETALRALGLNVEVDRESVDTLCNALRTGERLLVFDNCEHLIAASANLIARLLRECADLKVLATSREPLKLAGELVYPLSTLTFPNPRDLSVAALLLQYEAARLFVERARAVNPQFVLNETSAYAVAQICARLDGIPLAIELAAARARTLTAQEIAARLDDRFRLLTQGERNALPRQQTLYALIDWSYNLLNENERRMFAQLAVFSGGFTLDAVEYVCAGGPFMPDGAVTGATLSEWRALDPIGRLVEKSLVVPAAQGETTRYTMLETIREFALGKLRATKEYETVRERHFDLMLRIAKEIDRYEPGRQGAWVSPLERELDNLRTALAWSLDGKDLDAPMAHARADRGLEMFTAAWPFWQQRGSIHEASEWLDQFLSAQPEPTPARARAFSLGSTIARMRGDTAQAADYARQGLDLAEQLGDKLRIGWGCLEMALAELDRDNPAAALAYLTRAESLFRELAEPLWVGRALLLSAETRMVLGELENARAEWERAMEWARTHLDSTHVAWGLDGLAHIALLEGRPDEAEAISRQVVELKYQAQDNFGLGMSIQLAAQIAAARHDDERAARLWGAGAQVLRQQGILPLAHMQKLYASRLPETRERMGEKEFNRAWTEGNQASVDQVLALVMDQR